MNRHRAPAQDDGRRSGVGSAADVATADGATADGSVADGAAVRLFHSLSDPVRLRIIRLLSDGERRVVELTRELNLAQSTVSGHLACLRSAGLVDAHPHGRSTFYALAKPELWELLAAAERILDADGSAGALCPERHRPEPAAACGVTVRGCVLSGQGRP
ncbi:winged helix-turn-helix transcriptional regulator [Phytoactinopolyspora alkaliphila]|uniref:Winged helix-turn-helix transcriptional regulator n=2 Tax=Phytoactinopolyspora alkaliphila TaxID=1783498 RepID=A0A6N9YMT6_9ACTN|nr:winged helix-turn-helix transcriptional regulator [Phytoactinopolyspora alkaliphila]